MLREGFSTMFIRHIFVRIKRGSSLNLLLINMGLLDELISGCIFLLDRLLGRIAPLRLLKIASLLALVGVLGLLLVRTLWFAPLAFFIVSLGSACLYPIVESQAYARLPGRSGMMRFISSLCQPFDIALPAIVGFVAGRFGLLASLALLGSAPVFFLLLAPRSE
jgi:hypothetical protein